MRDALDAPSASTSRARRRDAGRDLGTGRATRSPRRSAPRTAAARRSTTSAPPSPAPTRPGASTPPRPSSSGRLRPGAAAEHAFSVTVPASQPPGTVAAKATLSFEFAGPMVALAQPFEHRGRLADRRRVREADAGDGPAGRSAAVTDIAAQRRARPVTGQVEVAVPDGWTAPAGRPGDQLPAGGRETVKITVATPRDARQAVTDAELLASFVAETRYWRRARRRSGSRSTRPRRSRGYDPIDLGDSRVRAGPCADRLPELGHEPARPG